MQVFNNPPIWCKVIRELFPTLVFILAVHSQFKILMDQSITYNSRFRCLTSFNLFINLMGWWCRDHHKLESYILIKDKWFHNHRSWWCNTKINRIFSNPNFSKRTNKSNQSLSNKNNKMLNKLNNCKRTKIFKSKWFQANLNTSTGIR
jgi:hypothetical protein